MTTSLLYDTQWGQSERPTITLFYIGRKAIQKSAEHSDPMSVRQGRTGRHLFY
ncbi:hypothetical protein [Hydrotalea sp.]|nr:hypothetical protein [Hydrotalea sp.]